MALDQKFFKKSTAASGLTDQEEGLVLHLDANDVDSYDGDGSIWYDITKHEVNIPLVDKGTDLVLHLNSSDTASYPGYGTTWTDLSTYGNDAVKVDSPTYGADTRGYFDLDGSNDRFLISNDSSMFMTSNTGFTIELWVNRDSNAEMYFITPRDGSTYPYTLAWSGNTTHGYYGWISGSGYTSNVGLNEGTTNGIGEWDHVVLTQSSSDRKDRLYVNGTLTATSAARSGFHSSSADINIGAYWGDNAYVDGKIGVVRVYKTELTAAEIGQNFRAGHNLSYSSVITSKHQATQGALHTSNLQIDLDANSYSGSGNWLDGANDYDASITAATYVNDVNSDYFDFAGSTAHPVSISYNSILNAAARTWEFWVWFDTDAMNFFGGMWGNQSDHSTKTVLFRMKDGNNAIRAQVYEGTTNVVEPTTDNNVVNINEWNHIVFTSDNSDNSFKIYVNGVEKYSTTLSFDINTSSTENFIIGAGGSYSSNRLNGRVAQFRYYNAALTSAQVNTNYNATKALYQNPTLKLHFDASDIDTTANTWTDKVSSLVLTKSGTSSYDAELGDFLQLGGGYYGNDSAAVQVKDADGDFTVEYFMQHVFDGSYAILGMMQNSSQRGLFLATTSSYILNYNYNLNATSSAGQEISTPTNHLTANRWHHVVFVYDSSANIKFYVDGVLKVTTSVASSSSWTTTDGIRIGDMETLSYGSNGKMGYLKMYQGKLSDAQIVQNYLATKSQFPNGFNLNIYNGPVFSNANKEFSLNGSNQYFYNSGYPFNFGTNDYTVIIWFNSDSATQGNALFSLYNTQGLMIDLWTGGVVRHYHDGPSGSLQYYTSETVTTGTWYQLAVTLNRDNNLASMFLSTKSTFDSTATTSSIGSTATRSGNGGTNIGRYNSGFYFDGKIANVRVYQKALSSSEIEAVWNTDKNNIP